MRRPQAAALSGPTAGYVHATSAFEDELDRLRLLEQRYDARTFARLSALGPAAVRPGGWLLVEDADYVSLVAADPAHPRSARFDAVIRKLLTFFAASRAFDPFLGRRVPSLVAAAGLADTDHEAVACLRHGNSAAAKLLHRSLERARDGALRNGVVAAEEFKAVLAATRDPSFSFVDALSVAAWGRNPD
jgi:hypothetical protein